MPFLKGFRQGTSPILLDKIERQEEMGFFSLSIILRGTGADKFFLQKNTLISVMAVTSKTAFFKKKFFFSIKIWKIFKK